MVRVGTIAEANKLFMVIQELDRYLSFQEMKEKLANNYFVTQHVGNLIGFKLRYPVSTSAFYSWLCGVMPAYRDSGVAQSLVDFQEHWVRKSGFISISAKSMNRFPAMLRLLIRMNT